MTDIRASRERFLTYATIFTLLRATLIVPIVWCMTAHQEFYAFLLGAVALCTDAIDGLLARRMHEETRIGAHLDQMTDKALAGAIASTLLWQGQTVFITWLLSLWFLTGTITVMFQAVCWLLGKKLRPDRWDKSVAVLGTVGLILLLSPLPLYVPYSVMCAALFGWFLVALRAASRYG